VNVELAGFWLRYYRLSGYRPTSGLSVTTFGLGVIYFTRSQTLLHAKLRARIMPRNESLPQINHRLQARPIICREYKYAEVPGTAGYRGSCGPSCSHAMQQDEASSSVVWTRRNRLLISVNSGVSGLGNSPKALAHARQSPIKYDRRRDARCC